MCCEEGLISVTVRHEECYPELQIHVMSVFIMFVCLPPQGHMTGKCVNSTKTCEVLAWCPVEDDRTIPEYVP